MKTDAIQKNFTDVYDGVIPKRVPIGAVLPLEFCIQYGGLDLGKTQWTLDGVYEATDRLCGELPLESAPLGTPRYPAYLTLLGAKTYVMGDSGFMQHPEVMGMEPEDYDDFIKSPRDFIIEIVFPKLFTNWGKDSVSRALSFAGALLAHNDYQNKHAAIVKKLREKYTFYTPPIGSLGGVTAPFDYLADFLRGFTGITKDIKRCPEKIAEACDAVLPFLFEKGLPANPHKYGQTFMPLHMATYLRNKEFDKFYWPSFHRLVEALHDAGQPCYIFCEADWTRYLDYLWELPEGTRFCFEYGDPQTIKDKLGKKHILSGLYPVTYLKTATKQECVDKAKELIDIMAPGGNYIFNFDKNPFVMSDVNLDNYKAVLEYVAQNSNYANAGERSRPAETHSETRRVLALAETKYRNIGYSVPEGMEDTAATILAKYQNQVWAFMTKLL
ncbi:uroporphyrinogen decarboxylase family protein [Eubacterium callanderi]|uniref:uroporphyrinogen decarboxylase family protein n=1 Tax=Eubacterium callanderi TaxID=53442 RepID=UPI001C12954B|nr:uroporphyrinogen decarboxylase family protein [Eubacterium callanderi]MBU5302223.1 uroporphyrinogen decarboxylase [Eubacterium callanderi]WPK66429.1 hypothetical protein EUCA2A_05570 [Eubacterium callanderi]WPK70727.1 hypothetical protein EUCA11A_05570 [Eubacterium callanderi]